MSFLKSALALAEMGFHVFPLVPNSKLPLIEDYPRLATRDVEVIKKWWVEPVMGFEQPYNIGISTTAFGDGEALVVIDVDNKNGKSGDAEILKLELTGLELPKTVEQRTATGGRHLFFRTPLPLKQGTNVLGPGLDIRSRGGYVVGIGSFIDGKPYSMTVTQMAEAPQWLVEKCGVADRSEALRPAPLPIEGVDPELAEKRALEYLKTAPKAEAGGRNHAGFLAACVLKDLGVDKDTCLDLMLAHWPCEPMLEKDEVAHVVKSAYRYGQDSVGSAAPEVLFTEATPDLVTSEIHPFDKINKEFAFITAGGGHHILWETTDVEGKFMLEHLNEASFHKKFGHWTMQLGDKSYPTTGLWMKSPKRREYKGLCFKPELPTPKGWYNLWRGFSFDPLKKNEKPTPLMREAVQSFLDHAKTNVCDNNEFLFNWLMGYFAHIIQRPWEKPLVALVFKGSKGVGKNALIERVGSLLGNHFLLTSNRRYLVGNFNGHLENLLLFALDEAFWSGDKQAEGTLKDLITGTNHVIEHKGKETYSVDNCTRVCIIGNEDWLVPASQDERRFAVFDVGEGRKQDRSFFKTMREGMEQGGYRYLLRYFLDFDLNTMDVNHAPATHALMEQKVSSLDSIHQWWHDCIIEGRIIGSDLNGTWPLEIEKEKLRSAYRRYLRDRNIKGRISEDHIIGKHLKRCAPGIRSAKKRDLNDVISLYQIPDLPQARLEWAKFIGHDVTWEQ